MARVLWATVVVVAVAGPVARADEDAEFRRLMPFTSAETIFVGRIKLVEDGPLVPGSNPPIPTLAFQFGKGDVLRGTLPAQGVCLLPVRSPKPPAFDTEAVYIAGLRGGTVVAIIPAKKEDLERVKKLVPLPAEWTVAGGKPLSPWAVAGSRAWPKDGPAFDVPACAKTGRPALLCGAGVSLKAEPVPAKNPIEAKTDKQGDGTFRVALTNTTKEEGTVAGLLTDGQGGVLWTDSLLVKTGGKVFALPGGGKVTKDSRPLVLKAGEAVTIDVNTLAVAGVAWPRVGQRVTFDFLLGEKVATAFFYFFPVPHDALRDEALRKARGK
jgi:hypothetical protein